MAIRMSSTQFMYNYNTSLQRSYANQAKLFENADGSSLHRGSDDSLAYHKYLRYQNNLDANEQYQQNVKDGLSWMKSSDSAIVHMTDIMKTFDEKTVAAANDHNNESDWDAISKEMLANVQELVATCNTQLGNRYLFSGQDDLVKPFSLSTSKVSRGLAKTLDNSQVNFFRHEEEKDIDTNSKLRQMLTLTDDNQNIYYLDTLDGYIYTKDFMDTDYKNIYASGEGRTVNPSVDSIGRLDDSYFTTDQNNVTKLNFKVSDYFTNQGIRKHTSTYTLASDSTTNVSFTTTDSGKTYTYNGNTYTKDESGSNIVFNLVDGEDSDSIEVATLVSTNESLSINWSNSNSNTLNFKEIEQYIASYQGDDKYISMVKMNGAADVTSDSVNLTGQDMFGVDIFDDENSGNSASGSALINEMLAVLSRTEAHDSKWLTSDGITISSVSHNNLTIAETRLGARSQLYDSVLTMLENQSDNITEDISNVSSTDVAKLAVKLMEMQTLYNMSLSMGARILPQSLADYL